MYFVVRKMYIGLPFEIGVKCGLAAASGAGLGGSGALDGFLALRAIVLWQKGIT